MGSGCCHDEKAKEGTVPGTSLSVLSPTVGADPTLTTAEAVCQVMSIALSHIKVSQSDRNFIE